MILDRDAANFGEPLVDLKVAAVGRQERKTNRSRVVNESQRRLLLERQIER
jgi:hypothetical protein